jgi:addiction module RelE/StbE family toxin
MIERFEIGWSNSAGKDLKNIKTYLNENASERTATKLLKSLIQVAHTLEEQPERYPIYPPLKKYGNFRYIIKSNFKIIYEFTAHQVIIHRVIHTKRALKIRKI